MTIHTIYPALNHLHGRFSRDISPILSISTGDTVRFQTLDAGWCDYEQANPFEKPTKLAGRNRELDSGHALCGPIAIEGRIVQKPHPTEMGLKRRQTDHSWSEE